MTDLAELLLLCIFGRIFIYLWMEFPLPKKLEDIEFFSKLHKCGLCSGVYIYSILCVIYKIDVLQMLGFEHLELVGNVISGGAISFLVFLVISGYKSAFESIVIS